MSTQHTPGPWKTCRMDGWRVDFDFAGEGSTETHAVCDANGKIIAFAVDHADSASATLNTDHSRLIAAAPDLLEALQTMPHPEHRTGITHLTDEWCEWDAKRRAAIATATGAPTVQRLATDDTEGGAA